MITRVGKPPLVPALRRIPGCERTDQYRFQECGLKGGNSQRMNVSPAAYTFML